MLRCLSQCGAWAAVCLVVLGLASCGSSGDSGCEPNAIKCITLAVYQTCQADGSWGDYTSCAEGLTCSPQGCTSGAADGDTDTSPTDGDTTAEADSDATACVPGEQSCYYDRMAYYTCLSDGTWSKTTTACGSDQVCEDSTGECRSSTGPACTAPSSKCSGTDKVVTCQTDGTWGEPSTCATGQYCGDGKCLNQGEKVCTASTQTRCTNDGKLQMCNASGTAWSNPASCPSGYTCQNDACTTGNCTPSVDFLCSGDGQVKWCNAAGNGYDDPVACPTGQVCSRGSASGCAASNMVCTPGAYSCKDEHTIIQCNGDGSAYLSGETPCEAGTEGKRCLNGTCATLCEQAVANNSYIGCEYYAAVLTNPVDDSFKQGNQSEYAVVISNTNKTLAASVAITFTGGSFSKTVSVPAGSNTTVRLPYNEISGTYKGSRAFHIVSTIPVTAYQFNPLSYKVDDACVDCTSAETCATYGQNICYSFSNDASLLLPVHTYGTEYMGVGYPGIAISDTSKTSFDIASSAFLTIIAAENNTVVTFTASTPTAAGSSSGIAALIKGGTLTRTLNAGEVLQIMGGNGLTMSGSTATGFDTSVVDQSTCVLMTANTSSFYSCIGTDLSGSHIQASKPVGVFTGNDCSFVPHYKMACDHMEEQLFPLSSWTTQYIAARMQPPSNTQPNYYRIVASVDGTTVSTIPPTVISETDARDGKPCNRTMAAGDNCVIATSKDFIVVSNAGHPIAVAQFFVGQNYDNSSTSGEGDPSMMLIPPVEQFRYDYVFLIPAGYTTDYITILATTAHPTITMDGQPFTFSGTQIGGVNAYKMNYQIADGTHVLTSSSRIGLTVYGYDAYVSYAYPAGLDLTYSPYKR